MPYWANSLFKNTSISTFSGLRLADIEGLLFLFEGTHGKRTMFEMPHKLLCCTQQSTNHGKVQARFHTELQCVAKAGDVRPPNEGHSKDYNVTYTPAIWSSGNSLTVSFTLSAIFTPGRNSSKGPSENHCTIPS